MIRRRCSTEAADVGGRRHCSATNLPAIMGDGDALCGDRVDLPIIQHDDDDGGGGGETEDGSSSSCAKKLENKPPSVTSCLLPTRSLRSTAAAAAAQPQIITPHQTSCSQQADGGGIRSLSFSKILSFRLPSWGWGAPMSSSTLELDYYIDQLDNHDTAAAAAADKEEEEEELKQVCRSQSVPTSVRRFNGAGSRSSGRMRRVADYSSSLLGPGGLAVRLRVVPLAPPPTHQGKQQEAAAAEQQQDEQEDIAAEEAVCRICMVALSEEEVLKLECCCKGELALAHRACAIKWFSIKGNGTCDVCNQEVRNLPVTLRRLHGHPTAVQAAVALVQAQEDDAADAQHQHQAAASAGLDTTSHRRRFRVWHGTPILVIISMLAYFCFLEQLLVRYGRRPWHGGSGYLLALRLRPWPLLLSDHSEDGVQEICVDLLCSAVPLHCALHPPLLQICGDASCYRHHPVHLRRLQCDHLHQLCPPPDSQVEGQACGGIADSEHNWRPQF
ncbi:hypothetical protein BS78_04G000900 [Paspalum vaginatum]|nr:hypothetical protein BS78_04G000900 [Paspalum vaginatum]